MKVLVIEDQKELANNLKTYLEIENYHVETASDGLEGYERILSEPFDAIILDLNLPGKDGMDICRDVRKEGFKAPIIMLTARSEKESIISGFTTGADDYVTKPFDMAVLTARLAAAIRRSAGEPSPIITSGTISVNINAKQVQQNGETVKLSPKEYLLFEYLMLHRGRALSRDEIIEHVWGEFDALMFSQTVDVHIAYLRKKLGKETIKTVPGGYMIEE